MNEENNLNSVDFENDLSKEGIEIEHADDEDEEGSEDSFMGSVKDEDDDGGEVDYDDEKVEEF